MKTKKMDFELHWDEKNIVPSGYDLGDYESKGFLLATIIQDFVFVVKPFIYCYVVVDGLTSKPEKELEMIIHL